MDTIRKIYCADEDVPYTKGTQSAYMKLEATIEKLATDRKTVVDVCELADNYAHNARMDGYVRGFQYAMQIAAACGIFADNDLKALTEGGAGQ